MLKVFWCFGFWIGLLVSLFKLLCLWIGMLLDWWVFDLVVLILCMWFMYSCLLWLFYFICLFIGVRIVFVDVCCFVSLWFVILICVVSVGFDWIWWLTLMVCLFVCFAYLHVVEILFMDYSVYLLCMCLELLYLVVLDFRLDCLRINLGLLLVLWFWLFSWLWFWLFVCLCLFCVFVC